MMRSKPVAYVVGKRGQWKLIDERGEMLSSTEGNRERLEKWAETNGYQTKTNSDYFLPENEPPIRPLTPLRSEEESEAWAQAMIAQHRRKGTSGPGGWLATFLYLVVGPSFLIWLWFQIANLPAVNHFGKIAARCVEAGLCVP